MDFASLLQQANKNLKSANKKVTEAQNEASREKMREFDQIRLQKLEKLKREELNRQRREEERREQFQIPKKKSDSAVDPDRIKAFKAKQDEERRKKEKEDAKKREELCKLRLAANGGKANKKIAKHFGADVIDLQIKFGQDRDHIETLQKYKERNEEEMARMADHYRGGVAKAFASKKSVEERVREGARVKESGVPKKSLTVLSCDGFDKGKSVAIPKPQMNMGKKRPADEALDFNSLMKKAANISSGKEEKGREKEKEKEREESGSSYRAMKERYEKQKDGSSSSSSSARPSSSSTSFKIPKPTQTFTKAPYVPNGLLKKREEEPLASGVVKPEPRSKQSHSSSSGNASSSSAAAAAAAPAPKTLSYPVDERGKRILPGDLRYKQWLEDQKRIMEQRAALGPPPPPPMTSRDKELAKGRNKKDEGRKEGKREEKREGRKEEKRDKARSSHSNTSQSSNGMSKHKSGERRDMPSSSSSSKMRPSSSLPSSSSSSSRPSKISDYEAARRKILMREQRMKDEARRMERERREAMMRRGREGRDEGRERNYGFAKGYGDSDEEDDDEDEDSDLDSFIDDSGDLDDLSRKEFEETLKGINKHYDTKKWKMNERLIDERSMHSNWRQVEKEERASARAGRMEDVIEAVKYKSEAL